MLTEDVTVQIRSDAHIMLGVAVVGEKPNSLIETRYSTESQYVIRITAGKNIAYHARRALEEAIPDRFVIGTTGITKYRQPVTVEELADNYWLGTAEYLTPNYVGVVPDTYSFDTTGGTQHITNSRSTRKYPSTAPDYKNAIGVTDKSVKGTDIIVPVFNFVKTKRFDNKDLTQQFLVNIAQITGSVNNAKFLGFEIGEVLFRGATGSIQQINGHNIDGESDINFNFSASPNRDSYSIGDISGIKKNGWEYEWTRYKFDDDEVNHQKIQVPKSVHIEEVYRSASFSILGVD